MKFSISVHLMFVEKERGRTDNQIELKRGPHLNNTTCMGLQLSIWATPHPS
jgi:hypothetical protein